MIKYMPKQFISTIDPHDNKQLGINGEEKKNLLKKYTKSLSNKNINDSLLYSINLHLSGNFDQIYSKIFNYYINEINITCPLGIIFLNRFNKYYHNKYDYKIKKKHPIIIVNDQVIRNFVCFFTTLILSSHQNKLLKLPKIDTSDFNLSNKKGSLVSTNLNLVTRFIHKNDPKEIIVPLSEICNYLKQTLINNREHKIIYWISWLFEYEKTYHKGNLIVNMRNINNVDSKYLNDFVWILWDIIKYYSSDNNKKLINGLFELYTINYNRGSKKSKANIIIYAILLIVNPDPKIKYPVEPIQNEIYSKCAINSLKSNNYYLKLLQTSILNKI